MMDSADPLCGWSFPEVLKVNPGPATNDLYGQLFYYIRDVLYSFHGRLASHASDFEFSHIDAKELDSKLNNTRFARIEVSNRSPLPFTIVDKYTRWQTYQMVRIWVWRKRWRT